ncbi:hypothetical protein [Rossellomorea aquimaris]|uniref:Uncharacterized protein n=1 Tax=Rossellomorea aquimaris TaxID=189382 RepID=A0A366E7Q9_9BACI|nr:hypothetical protein [Rossellomorea aquimaris]RBO98352.1 hypothetical protein DET59_1402 [Rossellomorea aquimaris]
MKKIFSVLLTTLLLFLIVPGLGKVNAACSDPWSVTPTAKTSIGGEIVTPQCTSGSPYGWVSLRSTARLDPAAKNFKQYRKVGNASKALSDLQRYIATSTNPPVAYGSGKWAVHTPQGTVMFYPKDASYGRPAIKWNAGKEVIRYD